MGPAKTAARKGRSAGEGGLCGPGKLNGIVLHSEGNGESLRVVKL